MKKEQKRFLYKSIEDIRDTIRLIDAKIFGLLVILILPISLLEEIFKTYQKLINSYPFWGVILMLGFAGSWLVSLFSSVKTVFSIDNPSNHISGRNTKDFFYGEELFDITIFSFSNTTSTKAINQYYKEIKEDLEVGKELVFEQMKLIYIRSIKIKYQKLASGFLVVAFLFGIISWLVEKAI